MDVLPPPSCVPRGASVSLPLTPQRSVSSQRSYQRQGTTNGSAASYQDAPISARQFRMIYNDIDIGDLLFLGPCSTT